MPRNFLVTNLLRPIIGFMFYFSAKVSLLPGLFRKFCIKYRLRERVLRYVFPVRVRRLRYQLFAEDCVKIAKNFKPDIIHAHDFPCLIAANLVSKVLNVPYIYDTHELWCERNRVNTKRIHFDKRWELRKEKALVRMAASTITVCDSISDYLYKRFNAKRPVVLRNVPYRRNPGFNLNMRAKLGMRDSDFLAIYIGKATFGRGILDIVRALPKVDSRVKFICLGYFSPQFRLVFDRQVKKQNLQERVFTFGPVEPHEVAGYASCCDLSLTTMSQICLSYLYTLPNKLFESIQAGLPIIGPNSPEIINIVQNYECGLTYSDGNHTDLANKINLLVNSPDQLKILKMNSVKAAETLCWEKEQEGLIDLYSKICHEG